MQAQPGAAYGTVRGNFLRGWIAPFCWVGVTATLAMLTGPGRAQTTPAPVRPARESPELRTLRTYWEAAQRRIGEEKSRTVQGFLQSAIGKADTELQERQRTRNVRGIMVSRELKEALERVRDAWAAGAALPWPDQVRKENEGPLADIRSALERMLEEFDRREAEIRQQAIERFVALLPPADRPESPEAAAALFDQWVRGEWPLADTRPPEGADEPPKDSSAAPAPPETVAPSESPPDVIAVSEGAPNDEGVWTVVGRWSGELMGPEIIRLRLAGAVGKEEGRAFNPLTQKTSTWQLERLEAIPSDVEFHWRLKRLQDRRPLDVMTWPGPENGGMLVVRTPSSASFPFACGFEIQVAPRAGSEAVHAGATSGPAELDRPTVEVQITSTPPGAAIWVNGRPYREGGQLVRTPARIRLTPETHAIRLKLPGHADHVVPEFRAQHLRMLSARLTPYRDLPGKTVTVNPRQVWTLVEGVRVEPGDRLVVVASGEWKIGEKGETCGPDGYDRNDPAFKHYYEASGPARQLQDANYGALLVRIGFPGPVFVAGSEGVVDARIGGVVMLDVNEGMAPQLRKDNRGSIRAKVIVIPRADR